MLYRSEMANVSLDSSAVPPWPTASSPRYKDLPLMQWPQSVAIYQKWLQQTKLQHINFVGRCCHSNRGLKFAPQFILVLQYVFPYCNTIVCCCNTYGVLQAIV